MNSIVITNVKELGQKQITRFLTRNTIGEQWQINAFCDISNVVQSFHKFIKQIFRNVHRKMNDTYFKISVNG